jgi:hypothetical protein
MIGLQGWKIKLTARMDALTRNRYAPQNFRFRKRLFMPPAFISISHKPDLIKSGLS